MDTGRNGKAGESRREAGTGGRTSVSGENLTARAVSWFRVFAKDSTRQPTLKQEFPPPPRECVRPIESRRQRRGAPETASASWTQDGTAGQWLRTDTRRLDRTQPTHFKNNKHTRAHPRARREGAVTAVSPSSFRPRTPGYHPLPKTHTPAACQRPLRSSSRSRTWRSRGNQRAQPTCCPAAARKRSGA